jgi:hypothetical protein
MPGAAEGGDLEAIRRLAPGFLLGSALLIVAGLLDGGAQASIWILAILIAYEAVHFREQRARVRANPSATLAEMRG